jgi:hypothetical protein
MPPVASPGLKAPPMMPPTPSPGLQQPTPIDPGGAVMPPVASPGLQAPMPIDPGGATMPTPSPGFQAPTPPVSSHQSDDPGRWWYNPCGSGQSGTTEKPDSTGTAAQRNLK